MDNSLRTTQLCLASVLRTVNIALKPGEFVALIGPNGAGKSTLLRVLSGYLSPDSGDCLLQGVPLAQWSPQALSRHRAMMRQHSQVGFDWPVEAVVGMGRAPWGNRDDSRIVREVMTLTGCQPLTGRRYATLSGGEQQRVQLARALAQLWVDSRPQGWLFLDEPTSALDLYYQQHLLRLLKQLTLQGELHVCAVLHDVNLAALWADRLLLLHQGEVVAQGTPAEVLQADTLRRWYGAQVHIGSHPARQTPQVFLAP